MLILSDDITAGYKGEEQIKYVSIEVVNESNNPIAQLRAENNGQISFFIDYYVSDGMDKYKEEIDPLMESVRSELLMYLLSN